MLPTNTPTQSVIYDSGAMSCSLDGWIALHQALQYDCWSRCFFRSDSLFFNLKNPCWPSLPFVFWTRLSHAFRAYNPKKSGNYSQFYLMIRGVEEVCIHETRHLTFHGGQLLFCPKNSYPRVVNTVFPPCEVCAFYLDWDAIGQGPFEKIRQSLENRFPSEPTVINVSSLFMENLSRVLKKAGHNADDPFCEYQFWCLLDQLLEEFQEPSLQMSSSLQKILDWMDQHLDQKFQVETLLKLTRWSRSYLYDCFRIYVGMPPHDYFLYCKIKHAARLLTHTSDPITEIAMQLGFSSSHHFSNTFERWCGDIPRTYRKKHKTIQR